MGESNDRLRQARINAGFESAAAAAKRYGWTVSTYSSHENGQTPVPVEAAMEYGPRFRVSPAWILTGEGHAKSQTIVSVHGRVGTGAEIRPDEEQVPPEGLEEIETAFPLPEDAIAFRIEGDSQWPRYDEGDVVIVRTRGNEPESLIGAEAVIKTSTGQRYLKRIRAGNRKNLFDLESHNAPPIKGVRIAWCAEVHAVIRAGQWRKLNGAPARKRAS